ncbi:UNVERIFIED_CONTAM: hypothetical protein Slati_2698900, partial [Sesamum latifolium]
NLKLHNKAFLFPQQVLDFARSYLFAFESVYSSQLPRRTLHSSSWHPLLANAIKINFDGSILDVGTTMGLGMVARDSSGVCFFWQSVGLLRKGPAVMAEVFAAREAIRLAVRQSWQQVIFEGDCATLLEKLYVASFDQFVSRPLVLDTKTLASQLNSVSFLFVPRSGNSVALNLEGNSSFVPPKLDSLLIGDFAI